MDVENLVMKILKRVVPVFVVVFVAINNLAHADIGKNIGHFNAAYGNPVGDKPTSTGKIVAWKMGGDGVVMAEFGADGSARNVIYRTKGGLSDSVVSSYLSKNSSGSGSFYKVDVPELNSILANLPKLAGDPNAPEQVRKFSQAMNPQVLAGLSQTINTAGDLRATRDGKFLAMIDARGQVLILRIDGPSLPLLN